LNSNGYQHVYTFECKYRLLNPHPWHIYNPNLSVQQHSKSPCREISLSLVGMEKEYNRSDLGCW